MSHCRGAQPSTRSRGTAAALLALISGVTALLVVAAASAVPGNPPVGTSLPARPHSAVQTDAPLAFVANAGQSDARVRYQALGANHSYFFTDTGARLAFADGRRGTVLELGFVGESANAPHGERATPGRVNFQIGKDPRTWRTGLPTFGRLVYRDLWPGIDLVFRGAESRLKYELHVSPGARIGDVRLAWRGADGLSVDPRGNLRIRTPLGAMRDQRPVSYQRINGRHVPVASRFVLGRDGSFGFALGRHDPGRALVVDPGLVYSTLLGGSIDDQGRGIAVDSSGRAIVTGLTTSTDFPTSLGAFDTSLGDGQDAFVTRLDAAGSALEFSTYLGGSTGIDAGFAVASDTSGNVFLTGMTGSSDFPVPGGFDTTYGGSGDGFAARLDSTGALVAATYLGGTGSDQGFGIALDAAGSPFVTGVTASSGYPTTPGAFDTSHNGLNDVFVTTLAPTLATLGYSTFLGGTGSETGQAVAVDGTTGKAIAAGVTDSAGFPTTAGAFDTSANGSQDVFVAKFDLTGSALDFSTFLGSSGSDQGFGLTVDATGSPVVTGQTGSSGYPTTAGAFDTSFNGATDVFVTKLNAAGGTLTFSTFLGGASADQAFGVALDSSARPTVTGTTFSSGWPTTPGSFDTTSNGNGDVYATKVAATGASLVYSTFLGGTGVDNGFALAVQGTTLAYLTGGTFPVDTTTFPTTPGAFDTTANGSLDSFVTKLDLVGAPYALALSPATDSNEVDAQHCVTATVTDFGGQPVPGAIVRFSVSNAVATHAQPSSGAVVTDANGQAQFCYTARLPGQNTIHAFADTNGNATEDTGEPSANATKTWTLPPNTVCNVAVGGSIVTTAGDRADFGGNARFRGGRIQGSEQYVDHGPAQQPPLNVRSSELTALSCSGTTSARIFGTATINGSGSYLFRIDVTDGGEPGTNDTYGILVSNGYASGQQPLVGGNVQITA